MGKPLASWLVFDSQSNVLEGVPTAPDVGELYIEVKARDGVGGSVRDVFAVQVLAGSLLDPNSNDKVGASYLFIHLDEVYLYSLWFINKKIIITL